MSDYQTPDEILASLQKQADAINKETDLHIRAYEQRGYERSQGFHDAATTFMQTVGDKGREILTQLTGTQWPDRLVEHLGDHPEEAKRIAAMPAAMRPAAFRDLEHRLYPNEAELGTEPRWLHEVKGGKSSRDPSDPNISESQFEAAFKKKFYSDGGLDYSKWRNR
jgi:hypothetical protein